MLMQRITIVPTAITNSVSTTDCTKAQEELKDLLNDHWRIVNSQSLLATNSCGVYTAAIWFVLEKDI